MKKVGDAKYHRYRYFTSAPALEGAHPKGGRGGQGGRGKGLKGSPKGDAPGTSAKGGKGAKTFAAVTRPSVDSASATASASGSASASASLHVVHAMGPDLAHLATLAREAQAYEAARPQVRAYA